MKNIKLYQIVIGVVFFFALAGCGKVDTVHRENMESTGETYTEIQQDSGTEKDSNAFDIDRSSLTKTGEGIEKTDENIGEGILEVHFIDIGQGDSILVKQGDSAMVIDAGNNSKGTSVWSYLLSQDVKELTYAIGTHPDADHIGGLDVVLYKIDCETIFLPDCVNDTQTYQELMDTIKVKNKKSIVPKQGSIYSLGNAQFQILTDTDKDYGDNINNYSIAIRLTFGDTSFLFTGDAEEEAEHDMLASGFFLKSDLFKAAHHGADTANTEKFLNAVNPKYCVISCGQDNTYGHPRAGVLNNLRAMGVKVFRTDEQGTIVAVSNGKEITFNCESSETWKSGEPVGERKDNKEIKNNVMAAEKESYYILNINTKKFHRPDCSSISKIADKNKRESDKSREELIKEGYEPCKSCNP